MNIILGATGQIGSCVVKNLLADLQPVKAVIRDEEKAAHLTEKGAQVAVADCFDGPALTRAVQGGDTILVMTPENPFSADFLMDTSVLLQNVHDAVKASGIQRIVGVSSFGAQHQSGTGNLEASYLLEHAFDDLNAETVFIRPAYYYSNWAGYWEMAKNDGILPTFFPPGLKIPMIAPPDVGAFIANVMANKIKPRRIYEIAGPEDYSSDDIADLFSKLSGRRVTAAPIPRNEWQTVLEQVGFSASGAKNIALMTAAVIEGKTRAQTDILRQPTGFSAYAARVLDI